MRSFFKTTYYQASDNFGISDFLIKKKLSRKKLVLTYHNVLPSSEFSNYYTNNVDVSIEVFKKHLDILQRSYGIENINTLNQPDSKKGIYLSFDDAMLNNIEIVEPILNERGITAMFAGCSGLISKQIINIWRDEIFLILRNSFNKKIELPDGELLAVNKSNLNNLAYYVTNKIESEGLMERVYNFIDEIKAINGVKYSSYYNSLRYDALTLGDLQYLKSKGHRIVSHTYSHKKLAFLSNENQLLELERSKKYFDQNLGSTDTIVYPYGTFKEVNLTSLRLAENLGYKFGFMNFQYKNETNMSISRLNLTNIKSSSVFKGILARINKI